MAAPQNWEHFFGNWPEVLHRRGVLQTTLSETLPFKEFFLKDGMLLLERTTPDAMGARFVLLSFETIFAVKFTDPLRAPEIAKAGFLTELPKQQPQLV